MSAAALAASAAISSWGVPDTTVTVVPVGVCCCSDSPVARITSADAPVGTQWSTCRADRVSADRRAPETMAGSGFRLISAVTRTSMGCFGMSLPHRVTNIWPSRCGCGPAGPQSPIDILQTWAGCQPCRFVPGSLAPVLANIHGHVRTIDRRWPRGAYSTGKQKRRAAGYPCPSVLGICSIEAHTCLIHAVIVRKPRHPRSAPGRTCPLDRR
jgi:hypothetical protein